MSGSWLFGLGSYHDPNWAVWAVLVGAGAALLSGVPIRRPTTVESAAAALMLLPAISLAAWPYRAAPLLLFAGLTLGAMPIPRRWPNLLASGTVLSGIVLMVQSLAIGGYTCVTARSHELLWPLPDLLCAIAKLSGIDASLDGTDLALRCPRLVHRLGATWELILDPAALSFLVGALVMLCVWLFSALPAGERTPRLIRTMLTLAVAAAVWLPLRAGLLISVLMHRALRTEYEEPLMLMNQFWNPWIHLALLTGLVLLALRFVNVSLETRHACDQRQKAKSTGHPGAVVLIVLGSLALCMGLLLDPPGHRKGGRVFVDEHRSTWERTDRPYDTQWYGHESGYNYACIYDYCSRFYQMTRLDARIDGATLRNCDVLVVKVPTSRYDRQEVAAIERFVKEGGGLLLIGEHTNVFNTGTYINDIAGAFGFRFRDDCLFEIDTVFDQIYRPPLVAHPIVQNMPPLNFAVSCSIDPGRSIGEAVIRSTGLRSLPADYHASNFYPQVEDRAESRYGAFIQLWSVRHGRGRVAAFTDSTIFSNFATFEPGKAELMLGMLEWLNHRNDRCDPRWFLVFLGIALVGGALALVKLQRGSWVVIIAAATLGWAIAATGARAIHRYAMPLPTPSRPMVRVLIDRTVCDAPLSKSGFIAGQKDGFGIFERWILRLGYFTSRKQGHEAFRGDLLVFLHPNLTVTSQFRSELVGYVASGGKVLVVDSPQNVQSTADSLLYPFKISVRRDVPRSGSLRGRPGWPAVQLDSACEIRGGTPIIWLHNTESTAEPNVPVAAAARHGKGTVTVVGFGSRLTDVNMGVTGDVVPDDSLRRVYDLQFSLLRAIVSQTVLP